MAKMPSLPLFVDDYEAATAHLSLEEDGAYMRLLRICWRTPGCSVPDDRAWIMRRMRTDEATYERLIEPLIEEFFQRAKGRIFQNRLREEFEYVSALSERRKSAGKKGGSAKSQKNKRNDPSKASVLLEANAEQNGSTAVAPIPIPNTVTNVTGDEAENGKFEGEKSSPVDDPKKALWDEARAYLGSKAGSKIGQWVKAHGMPAVSAALRLAKAQNDGGGAEQPIAYIERVLRNGAEREAQRIEAKRHADAIFDRNFPPRILSESEAELMMTPPDFERWKAKQRENAA